MKPKAATGMDPPRCVGGHPFAACLRLAAVGLVVLAASGAALSQQPEDAATLSARLARFCREGRYKQAIPVARRIVEIREKSFGPRHPWTATSLSNLAALYHSRGDYAKAEPLYRRALRIRERALGRRHPAVATTLSNLAALYKDMADYARAGALYRRALSIRTKALGNRHPRTVTSLNNLAAVFQSVGDYARAEPLFRRALNIRQRTLGPEHPDTATSLNSLASLYESVGDYAKAEPLFRRALEIDLKALGKDHPATATDLNNLAGLYHSMGDYAKAEPLFHRALEIDLKALGKDHPATATDLNNMAGLYKDMGDYAKAESLFRRALEINLKALGSEHPRVAATLDNLAGLYRSIGDYAKAMPLCRHALRIREKALGPEHPRTAAGLGNLAAIYLSVGDYAKAEPLCRRALKIHQKALGSEHPLTQTSLNHLAGLYHAMGKYARAKSLLGPAPMTHGKAVRPEHPTTAVSLINHAVLYWDMGEYAKVEPLYRRALRIREETLGPEHPLTGEILGNLTYLLLNDKRMTEARQMAVRAQRAQLKALANVLSFTSERQRLAYRASVDPYSLFGSLGSAPDIALATVRWKGVVLDSLLEDRLVAQASRNPADRAVLDRLRSAKQRLTQLILKVPRDFSEDARRQRAERKARLQTEVEEIEAALARRGASLGRARRALSVTTAQVRAAIPRRAALIELLRYCHYLGKKWGQYRYGASVITPSGAPKWVVLGPASKIERLVKRYQQTVRGRAQQQDLAALLRALYAQLWAPIERLLPPDTGTVIISPDGELNFLSFATLLAPDDRFLSQKYSTRYVASGRDLLRQAAPSPARHMLVYANPDFGKTAPAAPASAAGDLPALRAAERRDLWGLRLPPLPGTARESDLLRTRARHWDWPVRAFLGAEATEPSLQAARAPHVLHLATHGFFLPETDTSGYATRGGDRGVGGVRPFAQSFAIPSPGGGPRRPVVLKNPMRRSGLALAGAQATLDAWKRGQAPPTDTDGIVTAEEVGGLNLKGTWLVTLSACDTGVGEARSGEGVMGLRRGFIQAGARNLLMTLWAVADAETAELMGDFYDAARKSGNAPQALAEVQRDWLVRLRKQRGLAHAVRLAGPFILSSQGPPGRDQEVGLAQPRLDPSLLRSEQAQDPDRRGRGRLPLPGDHAPCAGRRRDPGGDAVAVLVSRRGRTVTTGGIHAEPKREEETCRPAARCE